MEIEQFISTGNNEMIILVFFKGLNFCPILWVTHLGVKGIY